MKSQNGNVKPISVVSFDGKDFYEILRNTIDEPIGIVYATAPESGQVPF